MYINNLDHDKAGGNYMMTIRILRFCVKDVVDSLIA